MTKLLWVFFLTVPLAANANQRTDFLSLIKGIEQSCQQTYTDHFTATDTNHAQLYCLSAFEFHCLKQTQSKQINCDTLKALGDLEKCPVCTK